MRDFYEREGLFGILLWVNAFGWSLEAVYAIVRFGVRMLRSFVL